MEAGRRLPDLPAQLQGRQRRRTRRHRRRHREDGLPEEPRRRRDLALPVLPLGSGGRRLRRDRLPQRRPAPRHHGRLRRDGRGRARGRHQSDRGHRAQPHRRQARVLQGSPRLRTWLPRTRSLYLP